MTNIYTNEIELTQALDSYCVKRSALWNLFFGNRGFDGYGYSFKVPTKIYEGIRRDLDKKFYERQILALQNIIRERKEA